MNECIKECALPLRNQYYYALYSYENYLEKIDEVWNKHNENEKTREVEIKKVNEGFVRQY